MHPHLPPAYVLLAALACSGCASWPLYSHLPDSEIDASPAGTDPADAISFDWTTLGREADPGNDTPPAADTIAVAEGWLVFGALSDIGWNPNLITTHTATCGVDIQTTEYPPISQGDYTGDLDWLSFTPAEDGQLCVRLEATLPADEEDFEYDLIGYTLDTCGNPIALLRDDQGTGLGLAQYEAEDSWSTDVSANVPLSVLLAGFVAASSTAVEVPWRLGVALIPSPDNGGSGICPSLPESP